MGSVAAAAARLPGRILYQVHRDRAACRQQGGQPRNVRSEADREPLVLAANVIELRLRQATVSPFRSIAGLFGEPGCGMSGFERPGCRRSDYRRLPAGAASAPGAAR